MTKKLILIATFLLAIVAVQAQNYDQELADLLQAKRWFDAEKYYNEHKDVIQNDFVRLMYDAEIGRVFNRSDVAVAAYTKLIDANYLSFSNMDLVSFFGQRIVESCLEAGDYAQGAAACKQLKETIAGDPSVNPAQRDALVQGLGKTQSFFERFAVRFPPLKVVRNDAKASSIPLQRNDLGYIVFESKWNKKPLRTAVFTGSTAALFFWNKDLAQKLGVKLFQEDTIQSGSGIKALTGVMDSLTLGCFTIKNVPVFVRIGEEQFSDRPEIVCDSLMNRTYDVAIGLPILKRLGVVQLDFARNRISFPEKSSTPDAEPKNFYLDNEGQLVLEVKIASEPSLAFFNSGYSGGLFVNPEFIDKPDNRIPIKNGSTFTMNERRCITPNAEMIDASRMCDALSVSLNDVEVRLDDGAGIVKRSSGKDSDKVGIPDGFFGMGFIRHVKSAEFDFNRMVYRVER